MPKKTTFGNGNQVIYTYDAMGQKLKTEYYVRTMNGLRLNKTLTRTYCGNYIYENNDLVQVLFDGGYITFNGSDAEYHYYIQDHLGRSTSRKGGAFIAQRRKNNRIVAKTRGIPEQTNHYYPFGSLMGTSSDGDTQRYKYNGKELDRMNGLDLYDYGARFYDGIRFTTMDPLAEKYYSVSPYAYCANNPVRFIDPDGMEIIGQTRSDAEQIVKDLKAIFSAEEFNEFRKLIMQSGKKQNGKSLAKISRDALNAAFDNVELSYDQQTLVEIVVNTINSSDIHRVEYKDSNDLLSNHAVNSMELGANPNYNETALLRGGYPAWIAQSYGGGGVTMPTAKGTHSVIINNAREHPYGRAVTTGHELFGHGRPLALGRNSESQQHIDAIQAENLILRVMGIHLVNDGSNHSTKNIREKKHF